MQSWVRSEARRECSGPLDERVLIAEVVQPGRIAALAAHSRPDQAYQDWVRNKIEWEGPVRLLRVVAVDLDRQGQGLGHAAMESALDDIEEREGGERTLVLALIHERNKRSQSMATSHYLALAPFPCEADPEMQYWFAVI